MGSALHRDMGLGPGDPLSHIGVPVHLQRFSNPLTQLSGGLTSIHPLGQVPLDPLERILWPHHRRETVKHLFHVRGPVPVLLQHIRPGSGIERHTKHRLDRRRHSLGNKVIPQPHTRPCTQRRGITRCGICCDSTRAKDRFLCLGEVLLKRL